jgi:hypothetical protein
MNDLARVLVALGFFATVAYSVNAIARGVLAMRKQEKLQNPESNPTLAGERLARLEQAVDAIALEIERISEGQRFTTKLLSEQARRARGPESLQLSSNTPT